MNKAQKAEAMKLADYISSVDALLERITCYEGEIYLKPGEETFKIILAVKRALYELEQ